MSQRGGLVFAPDRVAVVGTGAVARAAAPVRQDSAASGAAVSGVAVRVATAAALLVVWSLTYLCRQPAVEGAAFSPFGNFALEGMLLAATWLGALATLCLATLSGHVVFREPGE
jgi:hypothetical protein